MARRSIVRKVLEKRGLLKPFDQADHDADIKFAQIQQEIRVAKVVCQPLTAHMRALPDCHVLPLTVLCSRSCEQDAVRQAHKDRHAKEAREAALRDSTV